jgi:WhiB family redox-sensing transcriptional regulator
MAREEPHGVWGGEIFEQGVVIAQKRSPGRPPKKLALDRAS